jgi:hypothetical protein
MTKRWMDRSHVYDAQNMCCIRRLKMSPFAEVAKWFAPSHFIRPLIAMKELIVSTLYLYYGHSIHM